MKKCALPYEKVVLVCTGGSCCDKKAKKIRSNLKKAAKEAGRKIFVSETPCLKACGDGPYVLVSPDGKTYSKVRPKDAEGIIKEAIGK